MGSFLRCQITFLEWRLDHDKGPCHESLVTGQSACKKKNATYPPSGLYLGTQSGMTQFVEWIEGLKTVRRGTGALKPDLPSWSGTGGGQLNPVTDAWQKSSPAGRV